MDTLRIRLLGGFEMERDGTILSPPVTPKSRSLLAYLIINRERLMHRETLCAALWPDESEAVARKALRTALWRIRSALDGGRDDSYVYSDAYQIGFRGAAPVWVDIWDFDDLLRSIDGKGDDALDAGDGEGMARAAALYRGPCAAGVYDDWLIAEQSRLEHAHLALLERIVLFHARNQRWMQAIGWAERALGLDPLREHLHRIAIGCYMSLGDRPSALRQYARCAAALRAELDIEPMPETKALHDQLQDAARDGGRPPPRPGPAAITVRDGTRNVRIESEIDAALSTLRQVTRRLDSVRTDRRSRRPAIAR